MLKLFSLAPLCNQMYQRKQPNAGLKKLGGDRLIEEGALNLKKLEAKIDTDQMNAPSFMMVLTGLGNYAYRREDGVYVVPIGSLKD